MATTNIQKFAGDVEVGGTVTGDGSGLTTLNGSQVTTGTVAEARIANLNASKITAGTLGTDRIPSLDASKITSGTLGTGRIPSLDASKITSGTLGTTLIPDLDASKITGGTITRPVHSTDAVKGASLWTDRYIYHEDDTNTYLDFPAADTFRVVTAGSERMRVTSDGNIGIGTNNPGKSLEIKSDSGTLGGYLDSWYQGTSGGIHLGARSSNGVYYNNVTCRGDGYTGIGITNPSVTFHHHNGPWMHSHGQNISNYGFFTGNVKFGLRVDQTGSVTWGNSTTTAYNQGIIFTQGTGANQYWAIGRQGANGSLLFSNNGYATGYIAQGLNNRVMNFTGQHRTFVTDIPFKEAINNEGLIVSANTNKYIKMSDGIDAGSNAITVNESLPVCTLSNVAYDKTCFGVVSASEDPDNRHDSVGSFCTPFQKENGDTRVFINSVGEGAVWVVNANGPIESGDYITTSNVPGYGMKQDGNFLATWTVAKSTMDCNFDPVTQPVKRIVKELTDINYYLRSNTSNEFMTEEEYNKLDDENKKMYNFAEVRQDLVNVLDEHNQLQWEDHPTETEKAYKIRYLTHDGTVTDEANADYTAAFIGCTYHCG